MNWLMELPEIASQLCWSRWQLLHLYTRTLHKPQLTRTVEKYVELMKFLLETKNPQSIWSCSGSTWCSADPIDLFWARNGCRERSLTSSEAPQSSGRQFWCVSLCFFEESRAYPLVNSQITYIAAENHCFYWKLTINGHVQKIAILT